MPKKKMPSKEKNMMRHERAEKKIIKKEKKNLGKLEKMHKKY